MNFDYASEFTLQEQQPKQLSSNHRKTIVLGGKVGHVRAAPQQEDKEEEQLPPGCVSIGQQHHQLSVQKVDKLLPKLQRLIYSRMDLLRQLSRESQNIDIQYTIQYSVISIRFNWLFKLLYTLLNPQNLLPIFIQFIIKSISYKLEPFGVIRQIGTQQRRLAWPLRKDDTHQARWQLIFF